MQSRRVQFVSGISRRRQSFVRAQRLHGNIRAASQADGRHPRRPGGVHDQRRSQHECIPLRSLHHLPGVAVRLRRPTNAAASRVAVAGHHRTVRRRVSGLGVSAQTVAITNTSRSVLVKRPLRSTYGVAGLTGRVER